MKTLQIEITKEDVENALEETKKTNSLCASCPTHQALRRYVNITEFTVNFHQAWTWGKDGECSHTIEIHGDKLGKMIHAYPTRSFEPGTYEIQVDEQYLKEEYK